jgi:hypothetical protein
VTSFGNDHGMNRAQRRAADKGKTSEVENTESQQQQQQHQQQQQQQETIQDGTAQDVTSDRAKNQRHGKVTADKWNQ